MLTFNNVFRLRFSCKGKRSQPSGEYGHHRGFEEMADDLTSKVWPIVEWNKGYMWLSLGANPHMFHSSVQVQQYFEQQECEENSDYAPTGTSPPSPSWTLSQVQSQMLQGSSVGSGR